MSRKSYRQAINEALAQEMRRDPTVIVMGEDTAGGMGAPGEDDAWGGPLGVTKGLMPEFGRGRVLDTPISESAFVGAAAGAAVSGLRPVVELMFVDFMGVCFDQIFNQAAKFRYMFGGKSVTPLVVRTMYGAGIRAASQHSQCLYSIFAHIPGLKVVIPSSPYEAKGLLIQSIRDDDPVMFFEHKAMYDDEEEVPDEAFAIPFGEANLVREGGDVTLVAIGRMVKLATEAADKLEQDGIRCTVLDPRTISPLDDESILDSVEETGRLVIVDEASPRCNMATDISALVAQNAFAALKAPIKMVTPLVVRTMYGAGIRAASQHSQCLYSIFAHIPGLKVVIPSSPYEAKGLLIQSIREDDPVMFFEHKAMYDDEEEVPDEAFAIPFGEANLVREGGDITLVAIGRMVKLATEAADKLERDGIHCTVLDPRTISPLDDESILDSVEETGRLVIVDEASPRCNMATDISALVAQNAFGALKAPIKMVTPPHTPVPFAPELEDLYIPTPDQIEAAVREVLGERS